MAVAAPLLAPAGLGLIGFGAAGIVKGTIAAKLMTVATVSAGGAMSTATWLGGTVAVLQSVAAAGMGVAATVGTAIARGVTAAAVAVAL